MGRNVALLQKTGTMREAVLKHFADFESSKAVQETFLVLDFNFPDYGARGARVSALTACKP
jgi:hypothetical protein